MKKNKSLVADNIKVEELPAFIPQNLKDVIANHIEDLPKEIGKQVDSMTKFKEAKDIAVENAKDAMDKATESSQIELKWYKSDRKAIEALQSACHAQSNAIDSNTEAIKQSFENQEKITRVSKTLLVMGLANSALNRMVIREISLRLQNASKEELDELARQELEGVLRQLKSQEDLRNRIENQKGTLDEHSKEITNLNRDIKKFQSTTDKLREGQKDFIAKSDEHISAAIAEVENRQKEEAESLHQDYQNTVTSLQASVDRGLEQLKSISEKLWEEQKDFIAKSDDNISKSLNNILETCQNFIYEKNEIFDHFKKQLFIYKIISILAILASIATLFFTII